MSGAPDTILPDTPALPGGAKTWAPGEPPVGNADTTSAIRSPSDFMGDIDARASRASADIAKAADRKLGEDSYLRQTYGRQFEEDRDRMRRAFEVESKTADDPALTHPWNADKERAERIKGPLENFGSVGMIFALAASAFTKTPMTSALNAGAAAMNAMREGDELAYKSAYQAWKDNTELVKKRFDMERAVYDDANKLATTDLNAWRNQMEIAASQFGDEKLKIMAQNGMIPEVFQTMEARANSIQKAVKAVDDQTTFNLTSDLAKDKFAQWKEAHPPPAQDAPQNEQLKYGLESRVAEHQALLDAKRQVAQSKSTVRGGLNPDQEFAQRWWAENPKGTAEEFGVAFGQYKQGQKAPSTKALSPDQQFAQKWWEEHPDGTAEQFGEAFATMKRNEKIGAGGAGGGARPGSINADRTAMDAQIRQEHPDWNDSQVIEERNRRLKNSTTGITRQREGQTARSRRQISPFRRDYRQDAQSSGDASRRGWYRRQSYAAGGARRQHPGRKKHRSRADDARYRVAPRLGEGTHVLVQLQAQERSRASRCDRGRHQCW